MRKYVSYLSIFESLFDQESFVHRRMFGCDALYLHGQLKFVLAEGKEPWDGVLVCTDQARQLMLQSQFPQLKPHKILKKWLYLSQNSIDFESISSQLVELVAENSNLIGVMPQPKRRKAKTPRPSKRKRAKAKL